MGAWRVCGVTIRDYWRQPGGDLNFVVSMCVFLFLAIFGRSVRAALIGRQFWVHPDDFCKNAGFAGFGSMDLRVIAASVREFRR